MAAMWPLSRIPFEPADTLLRFLGVAVVAGPDADGNEVVRLDLWRPFTVQDALVLGTRPDAALFDETGNVLIPVTLTPPDGYVNTPTTLYAMVYVNEDIVGHGWMWADPEHGEVPQPPPACFAVDQTGIIADAR